MQALERKPALLRILPLLLVLPICAKRFHRHYSGQPAQLKRRCTETTDLWNGSLFRRFFPLEPQKA